MCDRAGNRRRVIISGIGAVTPLGTSVETFWANLCAGRSGVDQISLFDATRFRTRIAAEVPTLTRPTAINPKQWRRIDRFAQFGLVAALEAWNNAGLTQHDCDPYTIGVLIGSSHGGEGTLLTEIAAILHDNAPRVSPLLIPHMLSNMAAVQVAIHLGLHGPSFTINSACATGAHAIGEAFAIIQRGDANIMLCGGAEACITPLTLAGDQAAGALSQRNDTPKQASRPFDRNRDGFVLGEGAAILVLEEYNHALARQAPIYAEIVGYATTTDALHETHPENTGRHVARAITQALDKAHITPQQIDCIFAHATSTIVGDVAEVQALQIALGDHLPTIPVTAIKSTLGHLLGAAGAIQAVTAVNTLQYRLIPPTINLEQRDPACAIQVVTTATPYEKLDYVLLNACGFGGHNVALIFKMIED